MAGVEFNVRSNIKDLARDLKAFQRRQVPFATALALSAVASEVSKDETKGIESTFDRPTAFTKKAAGVKPAKKSNLTATVFVRARQSAYLDPYLNPQGGKQVLGSKKTILMPIDLATNQFGNIPRGQLKQLKGRPGVFVGTVKTKNGLVAGVWQRPTRPELIGKTKRARMKANLTGHLVLLIRFTQPAEVGAAHNLRWFDRAATTIKRELPRSFAQAMDKALATAR